MKVPIDIENEEVLDEARDEEGQGQAEQPAEEAPRGKHFGDLTPEEEAAMVEAAKRAGAEAAEQDMAAAAEAEAAGRVREELIQQLEGLQGELEAAKGQAADAADRLLRLQADWDNYRRRTAAERLAERERAAERLVCNLLPVLDDMERASEHAAQNAEGDEKVAQFVEGVMAVHAKMLDILGKEGVELIEAAGEPFDPLVHQAVGRVEDGEAFDETVAQVYQQGYRMGGKVIRPAMVTVTFGGPKRPAEDAAE